jgi:hypothetical protein
MSLGVGFAVSNEGCRNVDELQGCKWREYLTLWQEGCMSEGWASIERCKVCKS